MWPPVMDKTAFVGRLSPDASDSDKETFTTYSGFVAASGVATAAIRINIQPASAETTALVDGVIGKIFTGYTSASGVVEGMQLTMSGTGEQYFVRGREAHDNGILPRHYELTLSKDRR